MGRAGWAGLGRAGLGEAEIETPPGKEQYLKKLGINPCALSRFVLANVPLFYGLHVV